MAQLRSMDSHMVTLMQQRNNSNYSLPSPTGQSHQGGVHLPPPSPHNQHSNHHHHQHHLGYHNSLMSFQQQQQQHFHTVNNPMSYNSLQETNDSNCSRISPSMSSSDYLNSMHQMVEANNLQQLHHNNDMNAHAQMTAQATQPPTIMSSGVYHSHQQHLAALAAHAQAQHDQKFAKSSLSSSSSATTTAAAVVASTMANQMSAASSYFTNNGASNLVHTLNDYDERSLSSLSNGGEIDALTDDEDDTKDPNDTHNIDVTSSPQSPQHGINFGNGSGLKRKSATNASSYCDDLNLINNNNNNTNENNECLSKALMNGNNSCSSSGGGAGGDNYILKSQQFEGGVRPRSLEDMQQQNFNLNGNNGNTMDGQQLGGQSSHLSQQQQQQQQKHIDDYNRMSHMGSGSVGPSNDQQDRLNDNDSVMNGSCASSEDLNQTNSSEQGEKITSGSDDEGECKQNFELSYRTLYL